MAIILVSIGNLASGAVKTAAGNAIADPISAEAIYWPAWILVGGVLIALLIVIGVLTSLKSALLAKPKKRDAEFTRMVCKQVWKQTDIIKGTFQERLRIPPGDSDSLRVIIRLLREDLAAPIGFVEQMRAHAPESWPDYELFAAFNNWGGKISAIESQLGDLQHMLSYPVVREPVDANREARLLHYYETEQAPLGYAIGQVVTYAIAICELGKKVLHKASGHSSGHGLPWRGSDHDDEHDHGGCEACGSAEQHTPFASGEARLIMIARKPEPKKDKKEEPKHAPQMCYCATPQPCHCVPMSCVCVCSCKSGKPGGDHPPH